MKEKEKSTKPPNRTYKLWPQLNVGQRGKKSFKCI